MEFNCALELSGICTPLYGAASVYIQHIPYWDCMDFLIAGFWKTKYLEAAQMLGFIKLSLKKNSILNIVQEKEHLSFRKRQL